MVMVLYNLPSLQGWFWHLPIHLLLLDSHFFPNSVSWGDRIYCYKILAIHFWPSVWSVFDVPLPWDPFDAQTKCQHCPLHPTISDNYAWLIPPAFVQFPHQQLVTNQWHFLAHTTLLLWDMRQLFWNHLFAEQLDCQQIRHFSQDFLLQTLMFCLPSWPKRLHLPKHFLVITHRHQDAKQFFCLDALFCLYHKILR